MNYYNFSQQFLANQQVQAAELDRELRSLLAIIHSDGGQHTSLYGVIQSIKDAQRKVSNLYHKLYEYENDYGPPDF